MLAGIHISKNGAQQAALIQEGLRWSPTQPGSLICGVLAPVAVLICINFICFYRSINGYFAADDFVHIAYLAKVFDGHPELLWQNFTGNWMQAEGTQFYRPLISITLAWDFLIGRTSGVVYHFSNTLFQIASTIFLFLLVRRLAVPMPPMRSRLLAFFAAALFAACPLHCEVVSWVIGRVDSTCTALYLVSFWLFLKSRQDRSFTAAVSAVVSFALSMMCKEMAVTLPAAAALFVAMEPAEEERRRGLFARALAGLRATWMLWVALLIMLAIRTAALGTLTGGYSGSVGDNLAYSAWQRFFGDGSFMRIFFPFNDEVFQGENFLAGVLTVLYAITAIGVVLRIFFYRYDAGLTRLVPFAVLWFAFAMAPTYQVFNIAPSLQCSRFVYLGTAPLCLLLASLLLPMSKSRRRFAGIATASGIILLSLFVMCGVAITQKNNLPWAQAADQVRTFRSAVEKAVHQLPAGQQLAIINVPARLHGAHMIYNGSMLDTLLSPPLSQERLIDRVISFEPPMWGEPDMINASRLRALVVSGQCKFVGWDMRTMQLFPINFAAGDPPTQRYQPLVYDFKPPTQSVVTSMAHLSPPSQLSAPFVDTVEVTLATTTTAPAARRVIILFWRNSDQANFPAGQFLALPAVADGLLHIYRFDVSEHKSWILSGTIERLAIYLPFIDGDPSTARLQRIQIGTDRHNRPSLQPGAGLTVNNDGTCSPQPGKQAELSYDATAIENAVALRLEISYPNSWFEHYTGTLKDAAFSSHSWQSFKTTNTRGVIALAAEHFSRGGFYEVRAFALDANERICGTSSDPINLQVQPSH